jgi:2',5'-phosphodiesterase
MSDSSSNHVVTTYNILSSSLGSADYYPKCDPDACNPKLRFPVIREKIAKEIDKRAIICLQEVSIQWSGGLHAYFASQGYRFITGMYGSRFNGYMGVGIAVPSEKYDILDADVT